MRNKTPKLKSAKTVQALSSVVQLSSGALPNFVNFMPRHGSYRFISQPTVIQIQYRTRSNEDLADIREARRRLADPEETVMPFDQFCRENGL